MILAQVQGSAALATEVPIYTVLRTEKVSIQCVTFCNQTAGVIHFRLRATQQGDETASLKQYVNFGTAVQANETAFVTGVSLAPGQSLYGSADNVNSSFNVFGEKL